MGSEVVNSITPYGSRWLSYGTALVLMLDREGSQIA
jgi:hypothetical protein